MMAHVLRVDGPTEVELAGLLEAVVAPLERQSPSAT